MLMVATNAHSSSDIPSYISRPLLLPLIVTTGYMILDDCFYCGARGTLAVSTSPDSSDRSSDISRSLLLPPTVAMGYMTLDGCCYCWTCGTCGFY
jgi:hypothetical protein